MTAPDPGARRPVAFISRHGSQARSGTYTPTTIEMDKDITLSQGGSPIRMRSRDTYRWAANDCPARQ